MNIPFADIQSLAKERLQQVFAHTFAITKIITDTGAMFNEIMSLDDKKLSFVLENHYAIRTFCKDEAMDFKSLVELDQEDIESLIKAEPTETAQKFLEQRVEAIIKP